MRTFPFLSGIFAALALSLTAPAITASAIAAEVGDKCVTSVEGQCGEGMWCDPSPGTCGAVAVRFGKCVRVSKICTREYVPVCGCDGKTYSNDCGRRVAQVGLSHKGKC